MPPRVILNYNFCAIRFGVLILASQNFITIAIKNLIII